VANYLEREGERSLAHPMSKHYRIKSPKSENIYRSKRWYI
jgi:hypothetical protein